MILCDTSSYFDTLLRSNFSEARSLRVEHNDVAVASDAGSGPNEASPLKRPRTEEARCSRTVASPVIKMPDLSYRELITLLYYIYTGVAAFAKRASLHQEAENDLTAQENDSQASTSSAPEDAWWSGVLDPASALDMYRIADKYDIPGLRNEALGHIRAELQSIRNKPANLLADLKSHKEIMLFPEIMQAYRDVAMDEDCDIRPLLWDELVSKLTV